MSSIEISIVIVNYKSQHLITQCVQSIIENETELIFEIIVVDNNSHDDAQNNLKQIYPKLKWIQMGYNSGFGRANNAGFKQAQGNYILILNSDSIILKKNTLLNCLKKHKTINKEKTILGIRLVDKNQQYQETLRLTFPGIKREVRANAFYILFIERLLGRKYRGKEYQKEAHYRSGEVEYINGAFLLLNRNELLKHQLFYDNDFFLYGEDIEWAWRARKNGFNFYHWHEKEIIHLGSASSKSYEKARFQQIIASDWLYLRKTRGVVYTAFTIWIIFANQIIDSLFFTIAKFKNRKFNENELLQKRNRTWIYEILKKYAIVILLSNNYSDKQSFKINCYD
tara:strand:- start:915 stop:1934 length:1020 start_codon:yes stop_codon:yes gene_type:complete